MLHKSNFNSVKFCTICGGQLRQTFSFDVLREVKYLKILNLSGGKANI